MTKRLWLSAASAGAAVLMLLTGAGCGTGAGRRCLFDGCHNGKKCGGINVRRL